MDYTRTDLREQFYQVQALPRDLHTRVCALYEPAR